MKDRQAIERVIAEVLSGSAWIYGERLEALQVASSAVVGFADRHGEGVVLTYSTGEETEIIVDAKGNEIYARHLYRRTAQALAELDAGRNVTTGLRVLFPAEVVRVCAYASANIAGIDGIKPGQGKGAKRAATGSSSPPGPQ